MPGEPAFHRRMLVGRIVVEDHLDHEGDGEAASHLAQKREDFLMAVTRNTVLQHRAGGDVACGKQRGGRVPLVVVRLVPARPFFMGSPGSVRSSAWI